MAYFSLDEVNRPPISSIALPADSNNPTLPEVAQSLLYHYFFLITWANIPGTRTEESIQPTPQFLVNTLGFTENQTFYKEKLASFSLDKIDPRWIKKIKIDNLGNEVQNRIGLGVAKYCLASMVLCTEPTRGLTDADISEVYPDVQIQEQLLKSNMA